LLFWHFLLLELRIKIGVIWRNVYVVSYDIAILLLPKVVANAEGNKNREKPANKQEKPTEAQPHSHNKAYTIAAGPN